jgi:hypothetical protein
MLTRVAEGGAMSKVVSMRLKDEQIAQLDRLARRERRTRSEMAALLLDETLRVSQFAFIEFKDTAAGREAFIKGTRLKVWQVVSLVRDFDGDVAKAAAHLEKPEIWFKAAMNYAEAFPEEIEAAIADNHPSFEELKRLLPNLEVFTVDLTTESAGETKGDGEMAADAVAS